jgi:hypothetical protein
MSEERNNPDQPRQSLRADVPGDRLRVLTEVLGQKARESTNSVYANALNLVVSDIDFKILFGEGQPPNWHTAVTMPWSIVKLLLYYLQSNLAVHEIVIGPVNVPTSVLPAPIAVPPDVETNQTAKEVFETLQALRTEFVHGQTKLS